MTRRWVRTFERMHTKIFTHDKPPNGTTKAADAPSCACGYLRSDLCGLLGIHHADVFEVFEGVLPVLLLGAHVLLQQAEDVARLRKTDEADGRGQSRAGRLKRFRNHRTP